jgi:hypothetical protein
MYQSIILKGDAISGHINQRILFINYQYFKYLTKC